MIAISNIDSFTSGQGLNLGLGDVDALVSCLKKAHDSGMDLSSFLHGGYHSLELKLPQLTLSTVTTS